MLGQNSLWVSWNAKFDAEFEYVEKHAKNSPGRGLGRKLWHTVIKVQKRTGPKKIKNVFCKCALELNFATINNTIYVGKFTKLRDVKQKITPVFDEFKASPLRFNHPFLTSGRTEVGFWMAWWLRREVTRQHMACQSINKNIIIVQYTARKERNLGESDLIMELLVRVCYSLFFCLCWNNSNSENLPIWRKCF